MCKRETGGLSFSKRDVFVWCRLGCLISASTGRIHTECHLWANFIWVWSCTSVVFVEPLHQIQWYICYLFLYPTENYLKNFSFSSARFLTDEQRYMSLFMRTLSSFSLNSTQTNLHICRWNKQLRIAFVQDKNTFIFTLCLSVER